MSSGRFLFFFSFNSSPFVTVEFRSTGAQLELRDSSQRRHPHRMTDEAVLHLISPKCYSQIMIPFFSSQHCKTKHNRAVEFFFLYLILNNLFLNFKRVLGSLVELQPLSFFPIKRSLQHTADVSCEEAQIGCFSLDFLQPKMKCVFSQTPLRTARVSAGSPLCPHFKSWTLTHFNLKRRHASNN